MCGGDHPTLNRVQHYKKRYWKTASWYELRPWLVCWGSWALYEEPTLQLDALAPCHDNLWRKSGSKRADLVVSGTLQRVCDPECSCEMLQFVLIEECEGLSSLQPGKDEQSHSQRRRRLRYTRSHRLEGTLDCPAYDVRSPSESASHVSLRACEGRAALLYTLLLRGQSSGGWLATDHSEPCKKLSGGKESPDKRA